MSGCKTKGYTDVLEAVMRIIHEHNQYGHKVKNVIFDNEMIFVSIGDELRKIGIEPLYTPAQRHNKLMERKMREIKDKCRAIRASQRYKLSDHLRGELLSRAISSINATPNGKTGPTKTPYQVVTGKKPIIPAFEFGQIGITNARRGDEPEQRAEYGIFLDNMYNSKSHFKVYVPSRRQVYSKRTFVPTTQYPTGWNLVPRMRDLNEMEEFIGKDDDIRSTSKIDLMNSNDPEDIMQSRLLEKEIERLSLDEPNGVRTSIMRGNDLINIRDNYNTSLDDKSPNGAMEDVDITSLIEDEDVSINQQLHTKRELDEDKDSLDDAKMIGNTNSNVSDRVLRSTVKLGNTHARML